jgi:hypothetical protein
MEETFRECIERWVFMEQDPKDVQEDDTLASFITKNNHGHRFIYEIHNELKEIQKDLMDKWTWDDDDPKYLEGIKKINSFLNVWNPTRKV